MQEVKTINSSKSLGGPLKDFFGKLASKPLLLAFLLNLIAFLICLIFYDLKYEVSDDYITDAVLSGAFGTGCDPQLLFGNVILGYILVFFYNLIPSVSFYFVLLVALDFISATVILYLLFKKKTNSMTVVLACIFLIYFSKDLYVLIQFTKVSAVAGIAGGLLILHGLWEVEKHKLRYIISGSLLMLGGTLVRFMTIYVFAAFLVLAFISNAVFAISKAKKNTEKSKAKTGFVVDLVKRFAVCVLIIGLLFGAEYLGAWIAGLDETHADFNRFHGIRCSITDIGTPEFEDVEEEYKKLGLDFIDYIMLNSWNFIDRDIYTDELIQKVAAIHRNSFAAKGTSLTDVMETLMMRQTLMIPAAAAVYLFVAFSFMFSKKRFFPLVLLVTSIAVFVGLICYGRTMYRVEWGVYFCAAACLLAGFEFDEEGLISKLKKSASGERTLNFGIVSIAVLLGLVSFVPDMITRATLLSCSDSEYREAFENSLKHSGEYAPEKAAFPTSKRKISPNIIKYMENQSDRYYMVDFSTGIQDLYFNYDPWIRPEQGLFCLYSYYGGCTMHHPGEQNALKVNGADPDNPYKSMRYDQIYLVDNFAYQYKILFFRKYYIPEAKMKKVNEVDGFPIWKVYLPD